MARIVVTVKGMTCDGCERRVSSALTRLRGVREAKADHRAERVAVSYDPERVSEQALREQIEQAGYEAGD